MESLKALRRSCKERKIPIISLATESFLGKLLRKQKPKICLEIGGAVGYSSIYIGELIHTWGGKITSFEISYPAYQEGLQNSKKAHCYNIISYPYDVRYAPIKKLVESPVDFIFIDGQKSQYGEYMEIIEKISSPHTVIVIDDVIKYHNKLTSLYRYLKKKQMKYKILQLEPDDGVMIINTTKKNYTQ
ncbi:MAG TPA: class I SAM-dependent methyltransferase [Candidatus Absconditabacterales bacterium]|nr:class I SAM-dependent methyltransferase [Candidatus Absconditabacterales bacterium]